jgi:hypothetical protein
LVFVDPVDPHDFWPFFMGIRTFFRGKSMISEKSTWILLPIKKDPDELFFEWK